MMGYLQSITINIYNTLVEILPGFSIVIFENLLNNYYNFIISRRVQIEPNQTFINDLVLKIINSFFGLVNQFDLIELILI